MLGPLFFQRGEQKSEWIKEFEEGGKYNILNSR